VTIVAAVRAILALLLTRSTGRATGRTRSRPGGLVNLDVESSWTGLRLRWAGRGMMDALFSMDQNGLELEQRRVRI